MSSSENDGTVTGLIVMKLRDRYDVTIGSETYACHQSGALRHRDLGEPVVGDEVVVETTGGSRTGRIVDIRPRRNRLSRRAAGPRPVEQILAANVDQIVPVFAVAQPRPRWLLLDRFLVECEAAGIPALVCITKRDLMRDPGLLEADLAPYRDVGYPIVFTSTETEEGLESLKGLMAGKISVLVGKSGVGKSTLINALCGSGGSFALRTSRISGRTGKGCHTTSEVRMIEIDGGGKVIDTPGIREYGLWDIPQDEIASLFPEMRSLLGKCRFGSNCSHTHEPGCAIKEGVREARIAPARYRSYLHLIDAPDPGEETRKHIAKEERPKRDHDPGPFRCVRCGLTVSSDALGTAHRNHCPGCLWSMHVDQRPGDRAAGCGGAMEPIAISVRPDGEWTLVHRCKECGMIKMNRIGGDDNPMLLMSLAARPLARPPFPLDRMPAMHADGFDPSYDSRSGGDP